MCAAIHFDFQAETHSQKKARRIVERLRERCLDLAFLKVSEIVELSGDACDPHHDQPDADLRVLVEGAGRLVIASEGCDVVAPEKIIAFSAWPANGRGVCNLGLALYPATVRWSGKTIRTGIRGWCWNSFCQTYFASKEKNGGIPNVLRCHLAVTKMLDYTAELGILQGVVDLAGYWEHRDIKRLEADLQHLPTWPADVGDGTGDADECYS